MPSLLSGALQSDPGSHFDLGARKTHLVPGHVRLSDDYWSLLLGKRLWTPPCKTGRERGPRVSLPEARKSSHLQFWHGLPEQGKSVSGGLVHQEPFLQATSVPCSQKATQYSAGEPLFQAGQQWQVDQRQVQAHQLDELALESSSSPSTTIITSDAGIKNNVATSISYTHTYNKPIIKMIHHVVHVTSTEAELFVIRCSINQALNLDNMSKVIVTTDSIHVARKIFKPSIHPY